MNSRFYRAASLFILCAPALRSFAQAPLIPPTLSDTALRIEAVATYPEVEACTTVVGGPDGSIYVGNDPRDGRLNTATPECSIVRFSGTGKDRKRTIFADKLYSPAGSVWHDGWLYVIHDPLLSRFKDSDGDGVADIREDLVTSLGLPPNEGLNDHVVSGFTLGMDGFFYISVGDRGIYQAKGKDGSTISLQGGGIVRCRPDGTQLEVFSSGTRNHLEVDLDAEDNAFTLDNTDDGNGWWTRLTHHIEGGYYGYPFLYKLDLSNGLVQPGPQKPQSFPGAVTRDERFLPAMTDFGGGSPTGGLCYMSDGLPEQYRGKLLFSEWGQRRVSAIEVARDGATFKFVKNEALVQDGKGGDFRPMQLSVAADGSLLIADWQWGGWKGPKTVGTVWRVSWPEAHPTPRLKDESKAGIGELIAALGHADRDQRLRAEYALAAKGAEIFEKLSLVVKDPGASGLQRMHALWAADGIYGGKGSETKLAGLVEAVLRDHDFGLVAQALRVIATRRLTVASSELTQLLKHEDARVRRSAAAAYGVSAIPNREAKSQQTIGQLQTMAPLLGLFNDPDAWVRFTARTAVQRMANGGLGWTDLAPGLASQDARLREQTWLAATGVFNKSLVEILSSHAKAADVLTRVRAVAALGNVAYQPTPYAGGWWGTQPVKNPPPPNKLVWAGTPLAIETLTGALSDSESSVRIAAAQSLSLGAGPEPLPALRARLAIETNAQVRQQLIATLGAQRDPEAMSVFTSIALDEKADPEFRNTAINAVVNIGGEQAKKTIASLADAKLSPAATRRIIEAAGELKVLDAAPALIAYLKDGDAGNRQSAVKSLSQLGSKANATAALIEALSDADTKVQQGAIEALGALRAKEALPAIIALAEKNKFRKETLGALSNMPDPAAIPVLVAALNEKSTSTRRGILKALKTLADQALPLIEERLANGKIPKEYEAEIQNFFHGGAITKWKMIGPFENVWEATHPPETEALAGGGAFISKKYLNAEGKEVGWSDVNGDPQEGHVNLEKVYHSNGMVCAYAYAEIECPEAADAKIFCGADDQIAIWLNGAKIINVPGSHGYEVDKQEAPVRLNAGKNRLLVKIGNLGGAWEFAARIPGLDGNSFVKSAAPEEKQRVFALASKADGSWVNPGDAAKGAKVFGDPAGPLGGICATCHAVAGKGGQIGPDLSAVAVNYKRPDLITSIHEPSKTIALGFEQAMIETKGGEMFAGALRGDTAEAVTLVGADAVPHVIKKADLKTETHIPTSLMPPGLTNALKPQEFADLLAYLETLRGK
ncbi:MAG: hypothetical protein JWL90_1146 [Chthoniobacteraceae bacterium]|nr:hypothetical protein [Chthoniobacteraceae bacterium]